MPVIGKILPYLNAFMMVITEIVTALAGLLGFELPEFDYSGISDGALDIEEAMNGASESAEKLRSGLRGFDKLNVITTPSASSGAGSLSTGIDPRILEEFYKVSAEYNDMMDNVETKASKLSKQILSWLGFTKSWNGQLKFSGSKLLKNLVDGFMDLNIVGKIFVGLGIYKVISGIYTAISKIIKLGVGKKVTGLFSPMATLIGYFAKLYKNTGMLNNSFEATIKDNKELLTGMNGLKTAVSGALTTFVGFSFISDSFESMAKDGITLTNVLTGIGGAILVVIGAITTMTVVLGTMSTTIAVATGGISLLVAGIIGVIAYFKGAKDETEEYNEKLVELNKTAKENADFSIAQVDATGKLAKELETLVEADGSVLQSNQDRVDFILTKLNSAFGTEYELINGKITLNGKEMQSNQDVIKSIDEVMQKKKAEAILNAYQDLYYEKIKRNKTIQEEMEKVVKDSNLTYTERQKKLQELQKEYTNNEKYMTKYTDLEKALYNGTLDDINKAQNKFYKESGMSYEEALKYLDKQSKETKTNISKNFNNITFNSKLELDTSKATANFNKFGNGIKSSGLGLNFTPINPYYNRYASGGMPPVGQTFVANENGPEIVGHLGGKSVVANMEQVLTAVSRDTDRKIASAMGNNGSKQPAIFNINVGSREYARYMLEDLNDIARTNGQPLTIGG